MARSTTLGALRPRSSAGLAVALVALAAGCDQPPAPQPGGRISAAMGTSLPPAPEPTGPATLAPPRVTYLGEIAAPDLASPGRIALTQRDELLVSDTRGLDVHLFSPRGRALARLEGFVRPLAVGAGPGGQIYVGEGADGSVRIVGRSGTPLGAFGKGAGELAMPADLAVDPATGEVLVVDGRRHEVRVFSAEGLPLRTLLSKGTAPGQLSFPTGIAVEPAGLVLADHDNARIERFTATGVLRSPVIGGAVSAAPGSVARPQGIALDPLGRLYVADAHVGRVQVFDPSGAHLTFIGDPGMGAGQLTLPTDVAIDRFGRLLVTSFGTGKVLVYGIDDWVEPPSEPLPVEVTIEPRRLGAGGRGRTVTVYVEPPGGGAAALLAEGAILRIADRQVAAEGALRTAGDRDADGVPELALKFGRAPLVDALRTPGAHEVTFEARLTTGENVEGKTILVLAAGKDDP